MSGSGQPDLCVDLFSRMSSLIANFNNNMANGSSEVFSHGSGFVQSNDVMQSGPSNGGDGASFEDTVNEYAQWFFIGSMLLFLLYTNLSQAVMNRE